MVDILWDAKKTVFPLTWEGNALKMDFSVEVSSAEVGSSRIKISGSLTKARAIDNLCFWPSDRLGPFAPIMVSYLFGSFSMSS